MSLKAEVVTSCDHLARLKFSPALPRAFTEHGALMAANALKSPGAVAMSVFIVRAFVKMREDLAAYVKSSGPSLNRHRLPPRRQIGFHVKVG